MRLFMSWNSNLQNDIICLGDKMIKKYRLLRNYSQEELSELLEISTRHLQRIENLESNPSIELFQKIVLILQIKDKDIAHIIKEEIVEHKNKVSVS